MLSVVAHPCVEYYGWFSYHAGMRSVLVACGDSEAVLVYRDGDMAHGRFVAAQRIPDVCAGS